MFCFVSLVIGITWWWVILGYKVGVLSCLDIILLIWEGDQDLQGEDDLLFSYGCGDWQMMAEV